MNKPDWKNAPKWADRMMVNNEGQGHYYWCNEKKYSLSTYINMSRQFGGTCSRRISDFALVEMRSDPWAEGEARMENIVRNAGEGEHYDELLPTLDEFLGIEAKPETVEADWINTFSGLPPIGTACLISAKSTLPEWHNGFVNFYGDKLCVYTLNNEECVKHIDGLIFKPLKSARELDRQAFIEKSKVINKSLGMGSSIDHLLGALFDAGYTAPKDLK
jgi:hypothetical protein